MKAPLFTPPKAKRLPHVLRCHDHQRIDDFYWLNQRDEPDVIDYLQAENTYFDTLSDPFKKLENDLFTEIKAKIKDEDISLPYWKKGYAYYTRYKQGQEHPIYCRKQGSLTADEEILLDVNVLAEGQKYCEVTEWMMSDDQRLLAYAVDFQGLRNYEIRVWDLQNRCLLPDRMEKTSGSFCWAADNRSLFYAVQNRQLRASKVMKHRLGESHDTEIFHEKDAQFDVGVARTKSEDYIFIYSGSALTSEYRFIPAHSPDADFRLFAPRRKALEYSIEHFEKHFFILTNWEAENFRLMRCPLDHTNIGDWEDVIAPRADVKLDDFEVFEKYWVLEEKANALTRLRIMAVDGSADYYLPFDEEVYSATIAFNPDFYTSSLRYAYSSLTCPYSKYDADMATGQSVLLKQQEVVDEHFSPDHYVSKRLWATAPDGVKVPISLVHRKDLLIDGRRPTLLYGYGSYGYSSDATFSVSRLSLLDRGFVCAIAHVRGGEEMGRAWYEDGKFLKKKNTFTDFIACAETLIAEGYTTPQKLSAMGGSAGGLLIGAVANMRPDLFCALVADVPFVDVLTTMLDEDIPLTTGEYEEWGNPNEKTYYDYILSYSPYDNVKAQDYPHLLVVSGYHDSQVQYWEPAKWVAKLRLLKTNDKLLLLRTEMDFGHSGASGRFESLHETAMEYAFLLYCLTDDNQYYD